MKTTPVRLSFGQLSGTVKAVPAAVAERLIESGQAEAVSGEDLDEFLRIRDGDPDVESRDPKPRRRR